MRVKNIVIAAITLIAALSARGQNPEKIQSDSLKTVQLKEAVVVARRDLVTSDADKITYNVQADPLAQGGNLIDVIRNIPMLSVNGEDNVLLNGSSDYKVLVNGRSTGMLARNFNQLVKSIPASSIKEIQVITNPPVKYDAEGVGGIINIIMLKRLKSGYNGSVGSNINSIGAAGGNGYVNAQLGKFTFSGNASGTYFPNPRVYGLTEIENYTIENTHFQRLDFYNNQTLSLGSFALDATYEPDSLNLITLQGWANLQKIHNDYDITETFWNSSGEKTIELYEPTVRKYRYNTFAGELAYQRTFKDNGGILTLSYSIDGNPNSTDNDVIVVPQLNGMEYHRHSYNTEHTIQQIGQIDYFATLQKKHQIETGAKYTLRSHVAESEDRLWDYTSEQWVIDNSNLNDLDYKQHILAAYASYGYKFENFTLKGGARLEYTLNRGFSKSETGNIRFNNSNFNVVPYFNAAWQISPQNTISFSYTRRLGRPSVSYLNPYIFEESPYSRMYGNPDLKTVVSDALTLTYRYGGETWDITARTYGTLCNNKIEYLSNVNPDGIKVSTYENAVTHNHIDEMISFSWAPGKKFNLQASAQLGYNYFHCPSLNQSNEGIAWEFDLSSNIVLWQGAMAFTSANIYGGETTLQRTYHGADYVYSFGLRQGLFQNRLVFTAMTVMPFQKYYYGQERDTYAQNYHQHNKSWYSPRLFRLNVSWRFGKTEINLKRTRKNNVSDKHI